MELWHDVDPRSAEGEKEIDTEFSAATACAGPGVALVDAHRFSRDCMTQALTISCKTHFNTHPFETIEDALAPHPFSIDIIVLHACECCRTKVLSALRKFEGIDLPLVLLTEESTTNLSPFLREAYRLGVRGFVSASDSGLGDLCRTITATLNARTTAQHNLAVIGKPRSAGPTECACEGPMRSVGRNPSLSTQITYC
ncbi:MAG TPA: hypothetical protein VL752_05185 [Acidisoma sp.]|uniref:hypothetical protein n=1 Tax=Acidisoma sp. TaxID=1872115 RepID=UPI002BDA37FD|nr:hypothetical protein [Acidisoma sp.]HTI00324.1 hypothetical protein [Acidisoma sp.]